MHEYYIIHCTHNHVSYRLYMYVIIQVNPIKDWVHRPRHCISFESTLLVIDCQLYFCSLSRLRISTILLELSFTRILPSNSRSFFAVVSVDESRMLASIVSPSNLR